MDNRAASGGSKLLGPTTREHNPDAEDTVRLLIKRQSPAAIRDAIVRMMAADPKQRITIAELFAHPLFVDAREVYYLVNDCKVPLVPKWRM